MLPFDCEAGASRELSPSRLDIGTHDDGMELEPSMTMRTRAELVERLRHEADPSQAGLLHVQLSVQDVDPERADAIAGYPAQALSRAARSPEHHRLQPLAPTDRRQLHRGRMP